MIPATPRSRSASRLLAMLDKNDSADFLLRACCGAAVLLPAAVGAAAGGDRVVVAGDNDFPGNDGRVPGRADDTEVIVLDVPGLRG
ncbi:hypothetical protein [Nonomuraea sp. PA05]|uniref:hypothetical protein n=1 Tax=Nonomuraea sp. PA05 TaxID=2604466 RepID=UPI001CA351F3|nr:hypothetical protein [Nonomuraea sp. PA05]